MLLTIKFFQLYCLSEVSDFSIGSKYIKHYICSNFYGKHCKLQDRVAFLDRLSLSIMKKIGILVLRNCKDWVMFLV